MAERAPSPLGRYDDSTDESDDADRIVTVRLIALPVRIREAARLHHDELMHEFALLAVSEDLSDDVPQRLLDLIDELGRRYAGTGDQPDAEVDAAFARGDATIDVTYEVASHVVEAADHLGRMLDEADEFCAREQMLTLQRSEIIRRFTDWYLEEFRRQVAGEPPRPWDGPLDVE